MFFKDVSPAFYSYFVFSRQLLSFLLFVSNNEIPSSLQGALFCDELCFQYPYPFWLFAGPVSIVCRHLVPRTAPPCILIPQGHVNDNTEALCGHYIDCYVPSLVTSYFTFG